LGGEESVFKTTVINNSISAIKGEIKSTITGYGLLVQNLKAGVESGKV